MWYNGTNERKAARIMNQSPRKMRRYPYFIGLIILSSIAVAMQLVIILDCFFPILVYEVDAVSSIMSTCSEVIAGMYGITLTGYIFFADRFQNTPKDDESLYDAVQALLLRYNRMAGIQSLMCLICIVCGEMVVLYGSNTILPNWLYRFLVNEILLLFYVTFDIILYFVISVLDPNKISRISTQKMAKISKDQATGDPDAFVADWFAIEGQLGDMRQNLVNTIHFIPGAKNKPELVHTLEILRNYGKIGHSLWRDLEKLRQYRSLSMHDISATVSKEMCDLARKVRTELEAMK